MAQRLLLIAVCAAWTWACGDDASSAPVSGPNYAGACNREAQGLCDEYANNSATSGTQAQCTGAGGTWTGGQCPLAERTGVCGATTPASRTFAYSEAAATSLMSTCPAGKFMPIAGATPTGGAGGTAAPMMMPDAALMMPDAGLMPDSGLMMPDGATADGATGL